MPHSKTPAKEPIREKLVSCGRGFEDFYIYEKPPQEQTPNGGRRVPLSPMKLERARNLNDKRARQRFIWIAYGNFGLGDYIISYTYDDDYLPKIPEDEDRDARNLIRRIEHRCKTKKLPPPKIMLVTENYSKTGKPCRLHHHMLISTKLTENDLRAVWRRKNMPKGETMGLVLLEPIRTQNNGMERLLKYITKYPDKLNPPDDDDQTAIALPAVRPLNKHRWRGTKNLVMPMQENRDSKFTRAGFRRLCAKHQDSEYIKELYPDHVLIRSECITNPVTGKKVVRLWMMRMIS